MTNYVLLVTLGGDTASHVKWLIVGVGWHGRRWCTLEVTCHLVLPPRVDLCDCVFGPEPGGSWQGFFRLGGHPFFILCHIGHILDTWTSKGIDVTLPLSDGKYPLSPGSAFLKKCPNFLDGPLRSVCADSLWSDFRSFKEIFKTMTSKM